MSPPIPNNYPLGQVKCSGHYISIFFKFLISLYIHQFYDLYKWHFAYIQRIKSGLAVTDYIIVY